MHADRLLKLAAFLRELPDEKFDFGTVRYGAAECGTVACAIGWTPEVFPDLVTTFGEEPGLKAAPSTRHYAGIGMLLFDISYGESVALFTADVRRPWANGDSLSDTASPLTVAKSIEAFVRWKEAGNAR